MKTVVFLILLTVSAKSCEETKNLYVADHLVDCTGVSPQKCMLIKEKLADEWQNFYGNIVGFTYEEGYQYLLRVKVSEVKNPPADGSKYKYTLDQIVEKKKFEKEIVLENDWKVVSMYGIENLTIHPTIKFDGKEKSINGFAGCNNFMGKYDPETKEMKLGEMAMTRKMCADMSVENQFTNLLKEISYYKLEEPGLNFYNVKNEVLMSCVLNK